jgi:hypothetical protein
MTSHSRVHLGSSKEIIDLGAEKRAAARDVTARDIDPRCDAEEGLDFGKAIAA